MSKGHPSVNDMLEDYLPSNHPTDLDNMLSHPTHFPLPLGHPDLSKMMAINQLPTLLFSAHPDIDANVRAVDGFYFPKLHPSVIEMLEDFLPPTHPLNLDKMLRNPNSFDLPDFHPSLSSLLPPQSTVSAISLLLPMFHCLCFPVIWTTTTQIIQLTTTLASIISLRARITRSSPKY